MITTWIQEIKQSADPRELGMILIHNGLVRATSKEGKPVRKRHLSFSKENRLSLRITVREGSRWFFISANAQSFSIS